MPVTGAIQIYLNNTNDYLKQHSNMILSIQSGFQRLIRFGMQEDLYVSGDVKHVSFIGTRIVGGTGIDYNSNSNGGTNAQTSGVQGSTGNGTSKNVDGSSSSNTAGIIIGVVGAAVFIVLLWTLLVIDRKRRSVVAADNNSSDNNTNINQQSGAGGGDEKVLSRVQGGFVRNVEDEENPYFVKAPLEAQVDAGDENNNDPSHNNSTTSFLPTAGTSDTIEMEEGDTEEEDEEEVVNNDNNHGELKVFADHSDDEEDENSSKLAFSTPWIASGGIQEVSQLSTSEHQSSNIEPSPNDTGKEQQQHREPPATNDSDSTDKEDLS
jgi:hypothetical protein